MISKKLISQFFKVFKIKKLSNVKKNKGEEYNCSIILHITKLINIWI